jgi:hypothetical protein
LEQFRQLTPSTASGLSGIRGILRNEPDFGFRFEPDETSLPQSIANAGTRVAPVTVKQIQSLIETRRLRSELVGGGLFSDPAWDIILELYLASLMQYRVQVSSVCVGLVPPTTTLRWVDILVKRGLISRRCDPFDARRTLLSLSEEGCRRLDSLFLQTLCQSSVLPA